MGASLAVHVGDGYCFVRAPPVGDGLQGEIEGVSHAHRPQGGLPQGQLIAHGVGSCTKAISYLLLKTAWCLSFASAFRHLFDVIHLTLTSTRVKIHCHDLFQP